MPEFLVEIELPQSTSNERATLLAAAAARGRELRAAGSIVRMWRVPGRRANVGIWSTANASELHEAISLPLFPWMDVRVTALRTTT